MAGPLGPLGSVGFMGRDACPTVMTTSSVFPPLLHCQGCALTTFKTCRRTFHPVHLKTGSLGPTRVCQHAPGNTGIFTHITGDNLVIHSKHQLVGPPELSSFHLHYRCCGDLIGAESRVFYELASTIKAAVQTEVCFHSGQLNVGPFKMNPSPKQSSANGVTWNIMFIMLSFDTAHQLPSCTS